jgi:hypothetical protein
VFLRDAREGESPDFVSLVVQRLLSPWVVAESPCCA